MAIERACSIQCTAMQIFVKNNMQWFARPLTPEEITAFLKHQQRRELQSVFAHANYLINLAATNPQFHFNSMRALAEELIRADQFRLPSSAWEREADMPTGAVLPNRIPDARLPGLGAELQAECRRKHKRWHAG